MKFEKIYGGRGVAAPTPVRSIAHAKDDTESTFAQILQEMRDEKAADLQDRDSSEPDTIITRVLADGSIVTRAYKGARLISETTTHGNRLTPSKALISERVEQLKLDEDAVQNPLLDSHAAQGALGIAAVIGTAVSSD